ncbi:MAG: hypothetical protein M3Z01_03375 [Thermoproteota archaeon]|nr:hypothetical protein [Thermoproteota archaeon]
MFASDNDSERATSIEDYQNTCTDFISDLSKDYKEWIDRYKLPQNEEIERKSKIDEIVKLTNEFIFKYGDTIKKIDIIMNDGINKMAENTAGYPFKFDIIVNNHSRYIIHDKKSVKISLHSFPRPGRQIRICNYDKNQIFLISSSNPVDFNYSNTLFESADLLDDFILIKPKKFDSLDVISITIKAEEIQNNIVMESRGYTSLIILK